MSPCPRRHARVKGLYVVRTIVSTDSRAAADPYLGAMLRTVWQQIREQLHSVVVRAGFDDLNPAHIELFRYPGPEGIRPSSLAAEMQISRQFVNDLVRHLERCGYVTLGPDPTDGRARGIRLTDKGRALELAVPQEARMAEQRISEKLGPRRFAELRRTFEELTAELPPQNGRGTEASGV